MIMVVGFGNTLLQDEGIGVHLVEQLQQNADYPSKVQFRHGGTASLELIPHLADVEHLIIIDALKSGKKPGTVSIIGVDDLKEPGNPVRSVHQFGLPQTLALAKKLGFNPEITIMGIEPHNMTDCSLSLSPALQKEWPSIVAQADQLIREVAGSHA